MTSFVSAALSLRVEAEAEIVLSIVPAVGWATEEDLSITVDGVEVGATEKIDAHGTRLHLVRLPVGEATVSYRAHVAVPGAPAPSDDVDAVRYLRPSRYAPSDALGDIPPGFEGLSARELVDQVPAWVSENMSYIPGSSGPSDTAVDTLRTREGVCRDYAHVTLALLRAFGVPARLVSAYAPGLDPMDFHAVVEAFVDGRWEVLDATRLAPRGHLIRIATGRDAADTAFLTTLSGTVSLESVEVMAVEEGPLVLDDLTASVLMR